MVIWLLLFPWQEREKKKTSKEYKKTKVNLAFDAADGERH